MSKQVRTKRCACMFGVCSERRGKMCLACNAIGSNVQRGWEEMKNIVFVHRFLNTVIHTDGMLHHGQCKYWMLGLVDGVETLVPTGTAKDRIPIGFEPLLHLMGVSKSRCGSLPELRCIWRLHDGADLGKITLSMLRLYEDMQRSV